MSIGEVLPSLIVASKLNTQLDCCTCSGMLLPPVTDLCSSWLLPSALNSSSQLLLFQLGPTTGCPLGCWVFLNSGSISILSFCICITKKTYCMWCIWYWQASGFEIPLCLPSTDKDLVASGSLLWKASSLCCSALQSLLCFSVHRWEIYVHHCLVSLFLLIGKIVQSKNSEILLTGGITVGKADAQCIPRVVLYPFFFGHWCPALDFSYC